MAFSPERLIKIRKGLHLNKAEASRRLHLTPMAYGRYESGDRTPSYQTIQYISLTFHTTYEYLCGLTDDPSAEVLVIRKSSDPELFEMTETIVEKHSDMRKRLLAYYRFLQTDQADTDE